MQEKETQSLEGKEIPTIEKQIGALAVLQK